MHGLDWYDYGARNYEPILSRFTTPDPLAEKYYSISPYAYCAGNPVMYTDPTGMAYTKYEDEEGNELLNTNDSSKAVVVVEKDHEKGFEAAVRGTANTDDVAWNQAMNTALTGVEFTSEHEALLGTMNSDASRKAAIKYWQSGDGSDYMKFVAIETASQWTNPSLVVGGLSAGVAGLGARPKGSSGLKPLGLGTTGRSVPKNLAEQLALKEIMSNPSAGRPLIININDSRWQGWTKMSNKTAHGVEIHYNVLYRNEKIIAIDDFKFINSK